MSWGRVLLDFAMVVGPVLGYVSQYFKVRRMESYGAFSLWIPFILLTSNSLRLFFRIGVEYETTLALQAGLMILAQLALLHICVKYCPASQRPNSLLHFRWSQFWKWGDFKSYLLALGMWVVLWAILTAVLLSQQWYFELLGYISLLTESMLAVPQWLRNRRQNSVAGLSGILVLTWFLGDTFKAFYFVFTGSPIQFIICACVQLSVDIAVAYQLLTFKKEATGLPGNFSPLGARRSHKPGHG